MEVQKMAKKKVAGKATRKRTAKRKK